MQTENNSAKCTHMNTDKTDPGRPEHPPDLSDEQMQDANEPGSNPDHLDDFCWLCHYQGNRSATEIVSLIMDSVAHISIDSLVGHCKFLLDTLEADSNASKAEIKRHISSHMLHPRVKLSIQLQDMCEMQREVARCCVVRDVESGERTVNTQAMRVYLSLGAQVAGVYKTSEEKLLFSGAVVEN